MGQLQCSSLSQRLAWKRRLNVESLECRALLSGLTVNGAYGNDISGSTVTVSDVATDPAGNIYVTGSYTGNITVSTNGSTATFPDQTTNPETFVVSYSATGGFNWYNEFENSATSTDPLSQSNRASLAYDSLNQTVYVVGNFTGTVNFNPFGGGDTQTASTGPGSHADASDVYIIGLNASNGNENTGLVTSFEDFIMTKSSDAITATPAQVTVDAAGDSVYVTGYYNNADTEDFPDATITVSDLYGGAYTLAPPPTNSEGFSAKFNVNERLAWAVNTSNAQGSPLSDAANYGIAAAPGANVDYVVGEDTDSNAAFVEVLNDTTGQFVRATDLTLQPTGSDDSSSSPVDVASGVVTDSAGNAYVVGTFSGTLILPLQNLTSTGTTNAFIVSFNDQLVERWGDRFGSSNMDGGGFGDDGDAVGIDGATTPGIYVSGEDDGASTYGTSSTTVVGQDTLNAQAYVIEVASDTGSFISGVSAAGSGTSEAVSLAANSSGQVSVVGTFTSPNTLGTFGLTTGNHVFIANLTGTPPPNPAFDLAVTMTDTSTTYTPGSNTTYTITVSNNGPSAVTGVAVGDSFASGILFDNWTAVASTGASVTTASGSGDITQIVNLQAGATVTFTVVAYITAFATGNQYSGVAVGTTASTPAGVTDSNTANNSASVTLTPATPTPTPTPTPVFLGEHRVYSGKGKHKKLVGFELVFNGALNAGTAQNTSNYTVLQKKKAKHLRVTSATYNPSNFSVTLTVAGFSTAKPTDVFIGAVTGVNGYSVKVNEVML